MEGVSGAGPVHDDGELVTAEAGRHDVGAGEVLEALRQFDQQAVAVVVPEGVVDLFELVEVHQQHGPQCGAGCLEDRVEFGREAGSVG